MKPIHNHVVVENRPTPGNFLHPHQVSHALGGLWPAGSPCWKDNNKSPLGTLNRPHLQSSHSLEPPVFPAKPKGIVASDWLQPFPLDLVWLSAGEILRSVSAACDGVRKSERGLSEVPKGRPPRCATAGVERVKQYPRRVDGSKKEFGVNEHGVEWEANCWIPASDRHGFARLRCPQQNMINGTCSVHTWCVFTHQISWRRVKSVTGWIFALWRVLKKRLCSIYAACNDNYFSSSFSQNSMHKL